MRIDIIDATSQHFRTVLELHRANASTLGFLPRSAFAEYARRGRLLVAIDEYEVCVGYLLYWVSHHSARIAHLCVGATARGQGVAHQLVDRLHEETLHLARIRADCRRDYDISGMWPRLGFYVVNERPGRARVGSTLTIWYRDHGQPNLFTNMDIELRASKLLVALDANVFYDLIDPSRPNSDESRALQADWLQSEIELVVSEELWNEINRNVDALQRQRNREQAGALTRLSSPHQAFEAALTVLRPLFPGNLSLNDEGDLRQLARAVAIEAPFFVTRDTDLLERATNVYELVGVTIIRPSDLILHLDELRRTAVYQPARLAGTLMELRRVQKGEQQSLVAVFQDTIRETREAFERRLRRLLSNPTASECVLAIDTEGEPLALIATEDTSEQERSVAFFRVRRGRLTETLIRYGILTILTKASQDGRCVTRFTDPYLDEATVAALQQDGFVASSNYWIKLATAIAAPAQVLATRLTTLVEATKDEALVASVEQLRDALTAPGATADTGTMLDIERVLWPVKITDAAIPTFLVPIRPRWAQELFDSHLAAQTLFGSTKLLALNREAVYYRTSHPKVLSAPGRILWYVSRGERGYQDSSAVRAVSRLEEVVVGPPKDLFRRFQRFGIYEWQHVLETAHGDMERPIMAVRFSNTELFRAPIPRAELYAIYKQYRQKSPSVQGPSRVPDSAIFGELYRRGLKLSKEAEEEHNH